MDLIDEFVNETLNRPERFISRDSPVSSDSLEIAKHIFEMLKDTSLFDKVPIKELYTEGFDSEQIWEEIELLNEPAVQFVDNMISSLQDNMPDMTDSEEEQVEEMDDIDQQMLDYDNDNDFEEEEFQEDNEEDVEGEEEEEDQYEDYMEDIEDDDDDEAGADAEGNDKFFSMEEMEKFADGQIDDIEGEEIDYSQDPDLQQEEEEEEEEDPSNLTYRDFFDAPRAAKLKKRVQISSSHHDEESNEESEDEMQGPRELFEDDEDDKGEDDKQLTSHERAMKKLNQTIKEIEEENIQGKGWQLMGEVNVKGRPVNSLLEEDLEFDYAVKPAPVITEEVTETLEEIIKKRILEQTFDDVERKMAPAEFERKRKVVELPDAKPDKSLAEIYENEFQHQKEGQEAALLRQQQEPKKEHLEVEKMMKDLFNTLDALSNWNYTPKPPQMELKVLGTNDTAALEIEEIIPVNVSDAQVLAPQEILESKKSALDMKTQEELSTAEKKKLRLESKQKVKQDKRRRERDRKAIEKTRPGLGNKHATAKALKELSGNKGVTIIGADKAKALKKSTAEPIEHGSSNQLKL